MARCSVHGIKPDVKDHAQGGCSHSPTASICAVMGERKIKATGSMLQLILAGVGSEGEPMRRFTVSQLVSHPLSSRRRYGKARAPGSANRTAAALLRNLHAAQETVPGRVKALASPGWYHPS